MSKNRQVIKQFQKIYQKISQYPDNIKERRNWLLKTFLVANKRGEWVNSGFVLPTISFVSLVLVLLTTAILFRSLERAKNASNVRVNEAVLNAATPAIDRAKAKLNKLFSDSRLPRATPTDTALASHFVTYNSEYTFGDEQPLKLSKTGQDDLRSVWKFPVDTDNNGKLDSYTLYGIYFKNPPVTGGVYTRSRNSLEARSIPMVGGNLGGSCGDIIGTSATLVGNSGWFKIGKHLKKSFFVYTTNVPITNPPSSNYEAYKGNKSFSALEYQQERVQLPLVNNAVVYEDDLEITPGLEFRLNGRIITNSNLLTGSGYQKPSFYQISSKYSCFYEADNGKIVVGGNLGAGTFTSDNDLSKGTAVHLFKGAGVEPNKTNEVKANKSVTNSPKNIAYNSLAYAQRINRLVEVQIAKADTTDPQEVKDGISATSTRREQLELYFKKRTRRVPYQEVAFNGDALLLNGTDYSTADPLNGSGDTLRPPDEWIYPFALADGKTKTNYSNLDLNGSGNKLRPSATNPEKLEKQLLGIEQSVGDRIAVGNNLPELWWNGSRFVGRSEEDTQNITGFYWDDPNNTNADNIRTRRSQIQELADLGSIKRDGVWEEAAAEKPATVQDPVGGLRVVTGAGIYLPDGFTTTSSSFAAASTNIWSDMKPVPQAPTPTNTTIKPYWMYAYTDGDDYTSITYKYDTITSPTTTPSLRMRATAVYHHAATGYDATNPKPIACVSSFYVPTNSTTAMNQTTYNSETLPWNTNANGVSNNGIVYGAPTKTVSDYQTALTYISTLTYDNGRSIDDGLLASALGKTAANRTLSEKSAIDAQICALQILDGSISVAGTPPIPHGAIRENAFLDPRQVKTVHANTSTTDYNLPIKDREPLEIRVTVLDINQLRATTIGGSTPAQEYLIPNSGVIYASRDDALLDLSAGNTDSGKLTSPVDYKLDPNRRPNGIMLVNGDKLWRVKDYRDVEKGFILASNLPVYIQGDFNKHTKEEFTTALADDWSNFYTRTKNTLDPNFACRKNDPRLPNCTVGDEWRSAAVLSDAVTLLSNNYRLGYRDEGDYDWIPDAATIPAGLSAYFSANNSYVPVARWRDTTTNLPKDLVPDVSGDSTTTGFQGSSYLNNFVTPIALQIPPGSYLTEICPAANPADCSDPFEWKITTSCGSGSGNNSWDGQIIGKNGDPNNNRIKTGYIFSDSASLTCFPGNPPRRIAFARDSSTGELLQPLKILGVDSNGKVQLFPLGATTSDAGTGLLPPSSDVFMPWLKPIVSSGNITGFEPVLQINQPFATAADPNNTNKISTSNHGNWLQTATETTFNLIIASKDSPARPSEDNGGLHNFPRFIENWEPGSSIRARISGSFMQIGRSLYASAPFSFTNNNSYRYANDNGSGRFPYYRAPIRQWGYDVALLSQSPDLFAQKLVTIPDDKPDEYYREVGRDDTWVQTLLCARNFDGDNNAANDTYAIDASQRPSSCP